MSMTEEGVLTRRDWYMAKLGNSPLAPKEQRDYWLSEVEICNLALKAFAVSAIAAPALELGDRVIVALNSGHLEEGKVVDIGIWVKHDGDNSAHEYTPRQVSKVTP